MADNLNLDAKELRVFNQKSDLKGLWLVVFNWSLVVLAFALPAIWSSPLAYIASLVLLANRQLGLGILMHECAHYSLFKTHSLNKWCGTILCGSPVLADLDGYRTYHLKHHKESGTTTDPDYPNYKGYPVSKTSFMRKVLRDFSGITGVKTLYALMLMSAGILNYDFSYKSKDSEKRLGAGEIITNLVKSLWISLLVHLTMWAILYLSGHGWLYMLWWVSYVTVYMFITRVRNAAEHGSVPDLLDTNPLMHARTTYASWWERLIFAPNYVNYHLEHHLRQNIPCYNLKAFHHYLLNNGFLERVKIAHGYLDVINQLSSNRAVAAK